MAISDLSVTGMKIKVYYDHQFSVGDVLEVKFLLDDPQKTDMNKKVIVRNINFPFLGVEFPIAEREDKILGFYLLK